jgi:MFS transporter, DHA1 family, inner membrane transport protein
VPPLQKRVLDQAAGAPTLASAVNIGAFNLGNAPAAWLGGLVISAGHAYTSTNRVGAGLTVSTLVLSLVSSGLERGSRRGTGRTVASAVESAGPSGPSGRSGRSGGRAHAGRRGARLATARPPA